ncbi:MAG: isoprenyl transferase [Candidatus Omnitrophota bacterium]|jgi:undecaprenyl diphosphate synthase
MVDKNNIPRHIAIIMDGNGRWAKERGLPRTAGHRIGIDRVKEILIAASELQVEVVTLFAFSTENWLRPKQEINMLMRAFDRFLDRQIDELTQYNIRFKLIGKDDPFPGYLQSKIKEAQRKTQNNGGLILALAVNYGARGEIIDAVKSIALDVKQGALDIDAINEEKFQGYLYTAGLPDPDLLIRTSGEMRLSNFLLWQLSYAELYFIKKYWPDFRKKDLIEAIEEYQKRHRRFGTIGAKKK